MLTNMRGFRVISLLLLVLASHLAYSRSIGREIRSDGVGTKSFLEWRLSATTVTCEPVYGFLPCSTNVWGLLFLIVVYEVLMSVGGQYVANGSSLFFQITGPGVFGGSLFQFLGTIPQIVVILVSTLSGDNAMAEQRVTSGIGLVVGTTVLLLTLIWGLSVILGSYDLSEDPTSKDSQSQTLKGSAGIVTDVETSYTARIILISLIPFLILLLQHFITSGSGKRVVILIALIITVALLIAYMFYQSFQPWIQNRCFEFVVSKYASDKLLKLVSTNGKPDIRKIQQLYNKINKSNDVSVLATELRVLLLGVKIDNDDESTERDVENIMTFFDTSGDGRISQDEFIKGMTKLASDLSNQTPAQPASSNPQSTSQAQQGLLASSTSTSQTTSSSWLVILRASFFLIFGTGLLIALGEPLIKSVIDFAVAANLSSFWVSYLAIPLALSYGVAIQSIASATQKTQKSISLTLSSLYGGVYMNNIIGLIVFLAPVYVRNLSSDVSAEILVVLVICIAMVVFASFNTTFPRWTGYLVLVLYPVSLAMVYVLTSVLGWS
ncbi:hypothetical protein ACS0TY_018106 [Phlomoides rotata]